MNTTIIRRICEWYASQCNDVWEHHYGIKIETIDNPGWSVEVDLAGTSLEYETIKRTSAEEGGDRWYYVEIKDCKFQGACDPTYLEHVLNIFVGLLDRCPK